MYVGAIHCLGAEAVRVHPLLCLGSAYDVYVGIIAKVLLARYDALQQKYAALCKATEEQRPFANPTICDLARAYWKESQIDTLKSSVAATFERLKTSFTSYITAACQARLQLPSAAASSPPTWEDVDRMLQKSPLSSSSGPRGLSRNGAAETSQFMTWKAGVHDVAVELGILKSNSPSSSAQGLTDAFVKMAQRMARIAVYLCADKVFSDTAVYANLATPDDLAAMLPHTLVLDIMSRYTAYDTRDFSELNKSVPAADARKMTAGASLWDITSGYAALFADPIVESVYRQYVERVWPANPDFHRIVASPGDEPQVRNDSAAAGSEMYKRITYALRYALYVNGDTNFSLEPSVRALTREFSQNYCHGLLATEYACAVAERLVPQSESGLADFGAPVTDGLLRLNIAAPIDMITAPYGPCDQIPRDQRALVRNTVPLKTLGPVLRKLVALTPLIISDYHVRSEHVASKSANTARVLITSASHVFIASNVIQNLLRAPTFAESPAHLLRADGRGIVAPRVHYCAVAGIDAATLPVPPEPVQTKRCHSDAMDVDNDNGVGVHDGAKDSIPDDVATVYFARLDTVTEDTPVEVMRQLSSLDTTILTDLYRLGAGMATDESWGPACAAAFGSILVGFGKWLEELAADEKCARGLPWEHSGVDSDGSAWILAHAELPRGCDDDMRGVIMETIPADVFRDLLQLYNNVPPNWMPIIAIITRGIGAYCIDSSYPADAVMNGTPAKRAKI